MEKIILKIETGEKNDDCCLWFLGRNCFMVGSILKDKKRLLQNLENALMMPWQKSAGDVTN